MSVMPLELIIKELKSIEDQYLWIDFSENPTTMVISSDGLIAPSPYAVFFESPIDGPFILMEKSYKKFKIKKPDLQQIEEYSEEYDQAAMFLAGCRPKLTYYKWDPDMDEDDNYHERDKIFHELKEKIVEFGEPLPWDEVAGDEIVKYFMILKVATKGYASWDEIPCATALEKNNNSS